MRGTVFIVLACVAIAGCGDRKSAETAQAAPAASAAAVWQHVPDDVVPTFQLDPTWMKVPANWEMGQISDVFVDSKDHVWVLHRPRTVILVNPTNIPAPAVWELDPDGRVLQTWGGPGQGYDWPEHPHGLFVDHKGNVWLGGNVLPDNQVLKFSSDGKFLLQIGRPGQSHGNADTQNLNRPASVWVHPKTNELFVADGYGNRRVIVFDADSGAFKRMWGAFGNVPQDPKPGEILHFGDDEQGPGPQQFNTPHSVAVSNDDLVYVCDRDNQRVQVFRLDGTYVSQVLISHGKMPPSTFMGTAFGRPRNVIADELLRDPAAASRLAFSPDPEQRFLYVGDRRTETIKIVDRRTLKETGSFADGAGDQPGQLYIFHSAASDSQGNVYTAETTPGTEAMGGLPGRPDAEDPFRGNKRVQKFVFKGFTRTSSAVSTH